MLAPEAMANFITPKSGGSKNANEIASLYKIILYMAAVVFVIVEGALAYSVVKFRAKRGARAAQIHGNTRLEISWTIAAAADPGRAHRDHVRQAAEHHQSAGLESGRGPVRVHDPADGAEGQQADDLHPGPPVHLALHLRQRLR